jgi:hypothetical protein
MTAGQHRPGLGYLAQGARHDLLQIPGRQFGRREADQIQADPRLRAHRVDIAQGVGCRYLPVGIGVVNRRCNEIGGGDQGQFIGEFIDPGIIAGIVANQQIIIRSLGQAVEQCTEPDRVDFGRSAAGLGKILQGRFFKQMQK